MNWFLRGLFQPTENRHFAGKRLHFLGFSIRYAPWFVVLIVLLIIQPSWLLVGVLTSLFGLTLLDYFVFDMISDKLVWKYLFRKHYDYTSDIPDNLYDAMKNHEKNKTAHSKHTLEKALKEE